MADIERHFAPVEVAAIVAVETRTVLAWLRDPNHKLVGIKVGKLWRIPESNLKKFLQGEQ